MWVIRARTSKWYSSRRPSHRWATCPRQVMGIIMVGWCTTSKATATSSLHPSCLKLSASCAPTNPSTWTSTPKTRAVSNTRSKCSITKSIKLSDNIIINITKINIIRWTLWNGRRISVRVRSLQQCWKVQICATELTSFVVFVSDNLEYQNVIRDLAIRSVLRVVRAWGPM